MKGHENKKKNTPFQSQIMSVEKMVRDSIEKKCMSCVVARIYIVGYLVVVKRGVRVRRSCNIFNLAMENVLKGLHDKISCPDHRGLLRSFFPSSTLKKKHKGGI